MHPGSPAEPVLVAWGITSAGKPVFLGLEPGSSESHDAWAGFFRSLTARGLCHPLLVISDGGTGLIGAAEVVFNHSLRQRCLIHRARNILAKVPAHAQAKVKAEFWAIFDDIDAEPGDAAQAVARGRAKAFASKWRKLYPAAVSCLEDDFEHLITYLRFPVEHHGRIRHSNFIERTFGETRRRVKVIGRLPGERSCLSLVWAVLDRASRGWRGVQQTIPSIRLLAELRRELFDPVHAAEEVTAECHSRRVTSSMRSLRQSAFTPDLGRNHRSGSREHSAVTSSVPVSVRSTCIGGGATRSTTKAENGR